MAAVNVIYHHFPHYRAGVMRAMASGGRHEYRFWGGLSDHQGIRAFTGDEVVSVRPIAFRGVGKSGRVAIGKYWPAIFDPTASSVIIIGNANIHATWLMAIAARAVGKKVLFWAHGWRRPESRAKAMLRRIYYGLAHRVLLYGHRAVELATAAGFPAERLSVIYNSLDWAAARPIDAKLQIVARSDLRAELGLPLARSILMCSARLTRSCRFDLLIESAARLAGQGRAVTLVLVGDGPERGGLEALAMQRGVDARFVGAIYGEEQLARLYHAADLTVSPGKVGLTAIHSMTYGVPVITHGNLDEQMPEVEAIEAGHTGDFFQQGDVEDLTRVIAAWLDDARAPDAVAAACRNVVATTYNPFRQAELIDRAVSQVLGDGR